MLRHAAIICLDGRAALTAASGLFIVSSGPWLLRNVIIPSAHILERGPIVERGVASDI